METIKHETFGELAYNYGWKRDHNITLFGHEKTVILNIEAEDDAEFEDAQVNAYHTFFNDKERLLNLAEGAIFNYYLAVYEDYRQRLGEKFADKMAPILSTKDEIAHIVEPKQLIFPMIFDEDVRQVGLLLECTWEPEHGLAVKFEDEEIVEVGFQDIVL
ncbi:hypothetical protein P6709_06565 [Jeotgalibacillus sp. ET6]|uniref:DUF6985 domain-containing protein n=1 Tax=Jeotgalibacillus sp. ET6 TaxID=3037260 RepID=UPI00241836C4|nr:hypothetical protein [Jeotgalibacillus sp. ET6]MDG5471403.1 hypothetical protein [Jeotgalibacillus sp. ET6]